TNVHQHGRAALGQGQSLGRSAARGAVGREQAQAGEHAGGPEHDAENMYRQAPSIRSVHGRELSPTVLAWARKGRVSVALAGGAGGDRARPPRRPGAARIRPRAESSPRLRFGSGPNRLYWSGNPDDPFQSQARVAVPPRATPAPARGGLVSPPCVP